MNKQNKKPRRDDMYEAILTLETVDECKRFFDDLCTVTELQAMEQRYQVAVYLSQGMIYNDILERTGASSATISRVNRSLQYGADGYEVAFERLRRAGKFDQADKGGAEAKEEQPGEDADAAGRVSSVSGWQLNENEGGEKADKPGRGR